MTIKTPLLAGAAATVFALFVWAPADEQRGGVVLNRSPPQVSREGLEWELGAPAERMPASTPAASIPDQVAEEWTGEGVDPGVWATPATFSDSD